MATNLKIVTDAYRLANIIEHNEEPSAEQGSSALIYMNGMLSQWYDDDIDLGYFSQTSLTKTAPIPENAEWPVKTNLALILCANIGLPAPADILIAAESSYGTLLRKSLRDKLKTANMDHLPAGVGHTQGRYNILTDET